ncbi:MAG: SGNH/GDSL hydrolase family protein, partial [Holophaga sp.]|nr:SGNH/GDSL hydrolase family protein [Holophaga sp.]
MKLILCLSFWLQAALGCMGALATEARAPIALGNAWRFFGDSQTAGAADESSARSHAVALRNVWQGSFPQPWPTVTIHGVGGCSLAMSTERYASLSAAEKLATTFIHFQESGNQQIDGQRTAAEFAATFETFVRTVSQGSPNAIISYETAYSFQREASAGRNWNPYNTTLREKINALREQGFVVHLTDTDAKEKELVAALGFSTVIKD